MATPLNYATEPTRRGAPWWLWTLAALTLLGGAFYFFVPSFTSGNSTIARTAAARADVETLGVALALFKDDTGRFPTAEEGLGALSQSSVGLEGWRGPYIKKNAPRDPWGEPLRLQPAERLIAAQDPLRRPRRDQGHGRRHLQVKTSLVCQPGARVVPHSGHLSGVARRSYPHERQWPARLRRRRREPRTAAQAGGIEHNTATIQHGARKMR